MFKKVLIAEDMEDINKGVFAMLNELGIQEVQQVQYCDDAYVRIQKARLDKKPFDLLITDLSFKEDYRTQKYPNGPDLIERIRQDDRDMKIIVYSIEDKIQVVKKLFNSYKINGYVCKTRRGLKNLSSAITDIIKGKKYVSPEVDNALSTHSDLDITDYDIALLSHLSKGMSQEEISDYYKKNNISPASLSSIEKRLNKLRVDFNANNAIQLIAIVKDLGLI
ncbi:DNA-binding response regulator [Maribacter aurantiacus]|uniref:Response regulator transcription factor n=1 Tax=Maribacter aurantiacus TaxID=1882343 RepID=A0A5R8M5K0_9FLAO|nr:response regulator [Maribacter aurantiacus]TLF44836.1 response regulator transcription factor [Maribacter aurantiacus]